MPLPIEIKGTGAQETGLFHINLYIQGLGKNSFLYVHIMLGLLVYILVVFLSVVPDVLVSYSVSFIQSLGSNA